VQRASRVNDLPSLSLEEARRAILAHVAPLPGQRIPLARALGRVVARSIKSTTPKPTFDQSTRDGYCLADIPAEFAEYPEISLPLAGEIAAGDRGADELLPGQAYRIMTGAPVPPGCSRVVPFEVCREQEGRVVLPAAELRRRERFIRRRGSDLAAGRVLVRKGQVLAPDHLLMLVENGYASVEVFRRPAVEVLCTGSELVSPGGRPGAGQKISGNGILLSALVATTGGTCSGTAAVRDQVDELVAVLGERIAARPQMIITTGGMGPGRFDLVQEVFARLGGRTIYSRLRMRPGRSTLFGLVGDIPFFGLPGPPPAVRLLFHELVAPALRRLAGMRRAVPSAVPARLQGEIRLARAGRMNLKAGVARLERGQLLVRGAGRTDAVNAILLLAANRKYFRAGDRVMVHLPAQGL